MTLPLEERFFELWLQFLDDLLELTARYMQEAGPGLRAVLVEQTRIQFEHFKTERARASMVAAIHHRIGSGHILDAAALSHECRWFKRIVHRVDKGDVSVTEAIDHGRQIVERVSQFVTATSGPDPAPDLGGILASLKDLLAE